MSENIGQEIIVLRAQKGWTQQQLAAQLNTTQRTIASWESGASVPRKMMRVKIAKVFGLPELYFLKKDANKEGVPEAEMVGKIEELLIKTTAGFSEKKKGQIIEEFQEIITKK